MTSLSYIQARKHLASLLKQASDTREPVTITRKGHESVIVISKKEYDSMAETLHLLSSPANADRLRQGLEDFEHGNFSTHHY